MIAYAVLAGVSAAGLVGAAQLACHLAARVLPAGSGARRFVLPRRQLRAVLARSDRENGQLTCALSTVSNERDAAVRTAWAYYHAAHKAKDRIDELAEEAREAKQLREANRSLRAELANVRTIRPLLADRAKEDTLPRGIPIITGAPYASTDPARIRA